MCMRVWLIFTANNNKNLKLIKNENVQNSVFILKVVKYFSICMCIRLLLKINEKFKLFLIPLVSQLLLNY